MKPAHVLLLLIALAGACTAPPEEGGARPVRQSVPGLETTAASIETVSDSIQAFGAVAAEGESPEARDARTQLAEAEARQRLAAQQVSRLEALAQGAVAPRKELDAARAEQDSAAAAVARARQALAAFGSPAQRTPLAGGQAWVIAHVVQLDLARVTAGAAVGFVADALPDRSFDGHVDAAPAYVDPTTRTAPVRVRVSDPDATLRPGMTGTVTIVIGQPRRAVVVPVTAVVYDGSQTLVFVEENGSYAPRPVRLGVAHDGRIEIVSGLDADTHVVTTGAASLLSESRLPAGGDEE